RQSQKCQRIAITAKGRSSPLRAEACACDFYSAMDAALRKMESRMRKLHDQRRVHYGRRAPTSVAEATSVATGAPGGALFADGRSPAAATAVLEESAAAPTHEPADSAAEVDVRQQRWDDGLAEHV